MANIKLKTSSTVSAVPSTLLPGELATNSVDKKLWVGNSTNVPTLLVDTNANTSLQQVYPVGSIYMNASNGTNPATIFGFGTWSQISAGRMMMGAGGSFGIGSLGGTYAPPLLNHSHTATSNVNDPSHAHFMGAYPSGSEIGGYGLNLSGAFTNRPFVQTATGFQNQAATTGITVSTSMTNASAGDQTNGNLPPYIVVYMWQRTA